MRLPPVAIGREIVERPDGPGIVERVTVERSDVPAMRAAAAVHSSGAGLPMAAVRSAGVVHRLPVALVLVVSAGSSGRGVASAGSDAPEYAEHWTLRQLSSPVRRWRMQLGLQRATRDAVGVTFVDCPAEQVVGRCRPAEVERL